MKMHKYGFIGLMMMFSAYAIIAFIWLTSFVEDEAKIGASVISFACIHQIGLALFIRLRNYKEPIKQDVHDRTMPKGYENERNI